MNKSVNKLILQSFCVIQKQAAFVFFFLITKNRLISEHEQSVTFLQATCARFINFIDSPGHGYFSYDIEM